VRGLTRAGTRVEGGPRSVLGLCSFTHDSAAALLVDGALVGLVEEERLCGRKHTGEYPALAVAWLLDRAGLTAAEVGVVAYNFRPACYLAEVPAALRTGLWGETRGRALERARGFASVGARTWRRVGELGRRFPAARVVPVLHHRAHQMAAFAASGWDRAAVLVIDSLGERQTTTIGVASGARRPTVRTVSALQDPASLGYVYGAVTGHLGWRRGDEEGTVMALAALGDPARFRSLLARAVPLTADGFAVGPAYFPPRTLRPGAARVSERFAAETCPARVGGEPVAEVHRDLAAALQERTGQVMVHLARRARELTGERRLCVGGGVAMNCVGVGQVIEAGIFEEVFVPPAPGDAGTALGAAVAVHVAGRTQGGGGGARRLAGIAGQCYLGPSFPGWCPDLARFPGLRTRWAGEDAAAFVAAELADGVIAGVFRGRVEAGPRALGNRSILASPLDAAVAGRLNATVKFREPFRPFAPVVPAERAGEFFTLGQEAPFMSAASGVTALARERIPAIVHVNGTARVQTVRAEQNPFLHEVLTEFGRLTGVPVLINTSLNVKGQPICGTPEMALACLAGSGLEALLLEGWWVTN
jgi:carbamoyltransferase